MSRTVISAFDSREGAEKAVNDLRGKGFEKDISILAKDDHSRENAKGTDAPYSGGDSVANGVSTGGVAGGLIGLAAGAGALAIPGIGPLLAVGPIAGLLSGAATGGIAGGLADYGIPAERGRFYEDKIKQGSMLVTVKCDDNKAQEASGVLTQYGGQNVEIH
ncbi:MAG: membrane protein [Peptococcaceae bacterium BICA1-7]|nr:MAG: membrane protein [Peptococcaceae bacterium BICA1-7]HBV97021.1 hypothetical protein [Desulfotomaculum sp.]